MSHGDKGTIATSDNNEIYLTEFINPFKMNKRLKNKPKLFFIQACRGNQTMANMDNIQTDSAIDYYETDATRVPVEADFLYSYSSVEGYYSYRIPESGSLYIQALCDVISNGKNEEIFHILTQVNNLISKKEIKIKKNNTIIINSTMPEFVVRLTKKFYFLQNNKQSLKYVNNNNYNSFLKQNNYNVMSSNHFTIGNGKFDYRGDQYEGEYKIENQLPHGQGSMNSSIGTSVWRYVGNFKDGYKNGRGIDYFPDGAKYEGDFENDKAHGKGIYYYANGDRYEGDFKDDTRTGRGIFYYAYDDRYEGDFEDKRKHGRGIYYFKNGERYEGDFKRGKRTGRGIY